MLKIRNLTKVFGGKNKAVDNISLDVKEGEFIAFIGTSGSGKTTALRMINRMIEPTSGTIEINGKENLPEIYVLCGTDDFLIESNKKFIEQLKSANLNVESQFKSGGHTWSYWNESIRDAVDWIFKDIEVDKSRQIINWVG